MNQMVRLLLAASRGSVAEKETVKKFAKKFSERLDKKKCDWVDGGKNICDFTPILVDPSSDDPLVGFPSPLEPFVPETERFELLKAVKRVDELAESKKRSRSTEDEEEEEELTMKKPSVHPGNFQPIGQTDGGQSSVTFQQDLGGRRSSGATSAGIVRADDWPGPWSDISVELLQTREVYRCDIKNADWNTSATHVDALTFEK